MWITLCTFKFQTVAYQMRAKMLSWLFWSMRRRCWLVTAQLSTSLRHETVVILWFELLCSWDSLWRHQKAHCFISMTRTTCTWFTKFTNYSTDSSSPSLNIIIIISEDSVEVLNFSLFQ